MSLFIIYITIYTVYTYFVYRYNDTMNHMTYYGMCLIAYLHYLNTNATSGITSVILLYIKVIIMSSPFVYL